MSLSLLSSTALQTLLQISTSPISSPIPLSSSDVVAIVSKCMIYPGKKSEIGELKLSVSDLPMLSCHYIQKGLFFPRPPFPITNLITLLTTALSRALTLVPAFAGRLVTRTDGRIVIDCNDAGVEFSYAVAPSLDISVLLPRASDVPVMVKSLFPLDGAISYDGHKLPLSCFQLTELADGAVFIGAAVNHAIVDGTSFWNFFNSWAAICRDGGVVPEPPDFRRNYFGDSKAVLRFPGGRGPEVTFDVSAPLRERIFHFSYEAIQELKLRANNNNNSKLCHLGSDGDAVAEIYGKKIHDNVDGEISSFQSLCAHLWRAVTKARKQLSPTATTTLRMAVNCRHRVSPPVSPNDFGNAIQSIPTTAMVGELICEDLRWASLLVHLNVHRHDDKTVRDGVEAWEASPKCFPLGNPNGAGVTIGSSNRFPMYNGNDFGWGRPVAVRSGRANKFDGKMSAFPGRMNDGSVELEVCLNPEAMAELIKNEEFMNYVSE